MDGRRHSGAPARFARDRITTRTTPRGEPSRHQQGATSRPGSRAGRQGQQHSCSLSLSQEIASPAPTTRIHCSVSLSLPLNPGPRTHVLSRVSAPLLVPTGTGGEAKHMRPYESRQREEDLLPPHSPAALPPAMPHEHGVLRTRGTVDGLTSRRRSARRPACRKQVCIKGRGTGISKKHLRTTLVPEVPLKPARSGKGSTTGPLSSTEVPGVYLRGGVADVVDLDGHHAIDVGGSAAVSHLDLCLRITRTRTT